MKKKRPKTTGFEWLYHSVTAFNGSGYADYEDVDTYYESYVAYNTWKKRPDAVSLAELHRDDILPVIDHLLETSEGAGRRPSDKNIAKFATHYPPAENWIN